MKEKRKKLLLLLGLLFCLCSSWVQGQRVSLEFRDEALPPVFKRIEKVSGVRIQFAYVDIADYKVSNQIYNKSTLEAVQQLIAIVQLMVSLYLEASSDRSLHLAFYDYSIPAGYTRQIAISTYNGTESKFNSASPGPRG